MTLPLLLPLLPVLAGAVTELGPSPLAAEGHAPQWQTLPVDGEGEGWVDTGWHRQDAVEGRPVELVLLRMNFTDSDGKPMVFDAVMAVDCAARTIGIKETWFFLSRWGDNQRAPIEKVDMSFASVPPSTGDLAILAHACTGPGAAQ